MRDLKPILFQIKIILLAALMLIIYNLDVIPSDRFNESLVKGDSLSAPVKEVLVFLNWYKHNMVDINKIHLIKSSRFYQDTNRYYAINPKSTELYISRLKSSGFLSNIYLDSLRQYFKICDANFKANPQDDGPPLGLNADLIMLSNSDFEEDLANLDKIKVIKDSVYKDKSNVIIKFVAGILMYDLTKINNKWIIDNISNPPFEYIERYYK